jgi:beta-lactamase class A
MPLVFNRRELIAAAAGAAFGSAGPVGAATDDGIGKMSERLGAIEAREGGRLGVAVIDTESGQRVGHRGVERFPMCSTFKALAAAAVLKRVDEGEERLSRIVPYGPNDLLEYAPVTKARAAEGGMTVGDLCAAAIDWSDNTAANLILAVIGGPGGLTRFARSLGNSMTRLDRNEPSLNAGVPGDERDTTTPSAIAEDLRILLLGDMLSEPSRRQLEAWMIADKVGDRRLRAGLPRGWVVGDKTGSGDHEPRT